MKKDFDILSALWSVLSTALLILVLFLLRLETPPRQLESGVPVMMGALGDLDADYDFTPVNAMPAPPSASSPAPQPNTQQPETAITQNLEETVAIESGEKEKTIQKQETQTVLTPEQIRAQEEQRQKEQADAISNSMADIFGKSRQMQASQAESTAQADNQAPGSLAGNSNQGKLTGEGSYGTWDLGGRGMIGSLPKPAYDGIQEEGCVVVTITVNPKGEVIGTSINKRTNTSSQVLRNIAVEAAGKTRFNETSSLDNQSGTITYYFKLK